ncbi:hypothetical protein B0F90DRAFT_492790 [Multifurca ochricompacta]|uniref:Uncharacterized protein n=1 Tax=Multifurca ochricompacta TaxID=376703 RepID=A0AAD4MBB5_9AGAM|nr:hypothetical protein B0F90DRAFT_492790 [Multifurca ochricompacta]
MASTSFIHTTVQGPEHGWDGCKSIYTSRDSSHGIYSSEQPPTFLPKEWMDAPTDFSDPRLMRLLANNVQRLHTEVKGLWSSAPRSAHPVGTYERGVDYPRLLQLDPSFGINVKELPGRQGSKPPPEFHFATMAANKVPARAFSDRQSTTAAFNHVESSAHQGASQDTSSDLKSRDVAIAHASYRPYDDRVSPADRGVGMIARGPEPEAARGWRVNTTALPVTAASYIRKWAVETDHPIRARSLSETCDAGRRAFRAMADWITIYLFALVEGGRLPQDGAIDRLPLWKSMTAFQSTRQLIHRILVATAVPHSAVFLALWYIFRLPISPQTVVYAQDTARSRFRDSLKNGSASLIEDYMMRVFTAGIMLADKWVNDQTFQLRTWYANSTCSSSCSMNSRLRHDITGIPKAVLRNLEVAAMGVLEYNLRVSGNEWQMWLGHLTSWHSSLGNDPLMTIDTSPLSHALITTSLKDVVRASSRSGIRGTPEPSFLELQLSRITDEGNCLATSSASPNNPTFSFSMPLSSQPLTQGFSSSQERSTFTVPGYMKPWPGVRPTVSSF